MGLLVGLVHPRQVLPACLNWVPGADARRTLIHPRNDRNSHSDSLYIRTLVVSNRDQVKLAQNSSVQASLQGGLF